MLLELAVGDAYGAGFEYADEMVAKYNDLSRYVKHPRHSGIWLGRYTDDTQMTVAVAEVMIFGQAWTPLNIATAFVNAFKRDPREGYAGGFYNFLQTVTDGADFLARIQPDSDKSGAAMRASPIGLFPTVADVIAKCRIQAAITHNTPDGMDAACVAALASHYFLYRLGAKSDLVEYLRDVLPSPIWGYEMPSKAKAQGWMSARFAVEAVKRCNRLSDLLKGCVALRGDVDTVAVIALGAASCSDEYERDLPQNLVDTLENGAYGRDYLVDLDRRLMMLKTP